ncbi:MAG TPA: sigma-70 family RNA polymerase sigma factor [Solirubrobacteraceae bacterium]|nr:sigma-70 family RNA polymerase sigma factor [Solirubrobacteraceae bacterium]
MSTTSLPPFQRFLDTQREVVWRYLVSQVGQSEAEDCFQETFVAALRAYPRLRADSNLRAWVLTIAQHKALDAHRARARRATPVADTSELNDRDTASGRERGDGSTAGPQDQLLARDDELWRAVGALPERQRSAVTLRYLADLPHREIAAALDCSPEAARRSLHEGLTKLRKVVEA